MGQAQELSEPVHGFVERYDPWTGRAWLEVRGRRTRRVRIGPGYEEIRSELRARFPDRPLGTGWWDGQFPPAPFGLPAWPVLVAAWGLAAAVGAAAVMVAGGLGAAVSFVAVGWPLVRLADSVRVERAGLRLGPPWAPVVPWHEVSEVGLLRRGRSARIWARTARGGGIAPVPAVLVPAVRARIRRLGGLALEERALGVEARYALWRAVAPGIPWGLLLGGLVAMAWTPWPWLTLAVALLVVAGTALLGAAVEARATGWGMGGVAWLTLLYGLILAVLSLGSLLQTVP